MTHATNWPFALPDWGRDFDMEALASRFGTPFYLYDADTIRAAASRFREAFGADTEILYAVKANPNPSLLQLMHREALVDGLDIASSGELQLAQRAGWSASQLSLTGPAKSTTLLASAHEAGLGALCLEGFEELQRWLTLDGDTSDTTLMWRVNPAEELHAFGMQISGRPSPFGIDEEDLPQLFDALGDVEMSSRRWGLHVHAGSQCLSARAMARSMGRTLKIARIFEAAGVAVGTINFGGGFGVGTWRPPKLLDPMSVAGHLRGLLQSYPHKIQLRIEPGRGLVGPAGIFVARVQRKKHSRGALFLNLDGGMHHYFTATGAELTTPQRPIWVENLSRPDAPEVTHQLCGPLCTTRDQIGANATFPAADVGDLLGWPNAGAYGLTASPCFFLGHDTPAEILHDQGEFSLIRKPVSIDALGVSMLGGD